MSGLGELGVRRRFSAFLSPTTGAPSDDIAAEDSNNIKKENASNGDDGNDDKANTQAAPMACQNTMESGALDSLKRPREADAPDTASGGNGEGNNDDSSNPHRPRPKRIHYMDSNAKAHEQASDMNARYPPIGLITLDDNEITDFSRPINLFQGKKECRW